MPKVLRILSPLCFAVFATFATTVSAADATAEPVSFYKQIRPIFQANCQGCHQPAKSHGRYVMTDFTKMLAGGESESAAIVPGKPDESYLIDQIALDADGKALMPEKGKPLASVEIELIRRWIAEGAKNDTPTNARERFDRDHPPVYTRPPVYSSIDFSPDGQLIAVSGFHEVLLVNVDSGELAGRLIGLSERIQSVKFSPDGTKLLATGGLPARTGEVQIWDVAKQTLLLSKPVTYDTIFGGSWSPDGKLVAFGCGDNTVRAIDAVSGEQVLFQGAHDDLVRDTVFSKDGSHIVSVARDMSVKLTNVATQRFIDNVTSITPGALKGGVTSIARHPERDEVVIGGSDGVPKVYRMIRQTKRVIGDDANLIRRLPAMTGRIFAVAVSADGKRIAAGSSLDGAGEVHVFGYEFDTALPGDIKKIMEKRAQQWSADERKKAEAYWTAGVKRIADVSLNSSVYAVAFHPNGQQVAAAGADGKIRLIDAVSGKVLRELSPAPLSDQSPNMMDNGIIANLQREEAAVKPRTLSDGVVLKSLRVQPTSIELDSPFTYSQLLVNGITNTGATIDVTRLAKFVPSEEIISISPTGLVQPTKTGSGFLRLQVGSQSATIPVTVGNCDVSKQDVDFIRDVNPVLSRLGCNQGTCHGAQKGRNGFKLSLRGYDAIFDVRALTDDLASRRVNVASPDNSLMLMKATGAVPHEGGQVMKPGNAHYLTIRNWIAGGARLDRNATRVTSIEIQPQNPVIQAIDSRQQIRVIAGYSDGSSKDVTREAFVTSGNTEVGDISETGILTAIRRGEAPVLARFEGAYAATTLTVMGNRDGFVWEQPETWNRIDELVADKWQQVKTKPSGLCNDAEFIRRVTLDLTGLPPTADDVRAFLADKRETRVKRDELIDRLIGNKDYVDHWTNKWADLLMVNRKFLGAEGAAAFRTWIRQRIDQNLPYDEFSRQVLTASGSNRENPAAGYFKILRDPAETMENTTHLFLGVRFNCNKCHDHPFERWTQDQYYETAAYFAQVGLKADPMSGKRRIGGTAVEGAKPFYEIVYDMPAGDITHERTGDVTSPEFPFSCDYETAEGMSRRAKLASWITSPDNPYFARSYANRMWGYLLGVGLMEPIDDLRAGNPPTNPELLTYLTNEFVNCGFDVRELVRMICKSRTYQLSIATNAWNEDDHINYSHAKARRLPAEVLYDALHRVTGSVTRIPGVPAGTRAAELPDVGVTLPSGFLEKTGRPSRESSCECERSSEFQLGPVLAFVSGPTVANAIADPNNALAQLVKTQPDNGKLVEELFLRVLNRPAEPGEVAKALKLLDEFADDHKQLQAELAKAEAAWQPRRAELDKQREVRMTSARDALMAYEKTAEPKIAAAKVAQQQKVATLTAELAKFRDSLQDDFAAWESQQSRTTGWQTLQFQQLTSTNRAKLQQEKDGGVFVTGPTGKTEYVLTAHVSDLPVTGLRLEALMDGRLPGKGPGRPANGNFVVTEFEVTIAPESQPDKKTKLTLHNAQADFSQTNYAVATAIDGKKPPASNGWAIVPKTGVNHTAVFEVKNPAVLLKAKAGNRKGPARAESAADARQDLILTITITQNYNDGLHALGRFRIAYSTDRAPLQFGMPQDIKAILATTNSKRTDKQSQRLFDYFARQNADYQKKQSDVVAAKQPLPVDPDLKKLQENLKTAGQPVADDPRLIALRKTVEISRQQLDNERLTFAQDVTWALINTPAFLFNR